MFTEERLYKLIVPQNYYRGQDFILKRTLIATPKTYAEGAYIEWGCYEESRNKGLTFLGSYSQFDRDWPEHKRIMDGLASDEITGGTATTMIYDIFMDLAFKGNEDFFNAHAPQRWIEVKTSKGWRKAFALYWDYYNNQLKLTPVQIIFKRDDRSQIAYDWRELT